MSERYRCSQELLERALKVIPLGAQTFSKSPTQFPAGVSPHFARSADGSRLTDVDGNVYIDFVNALAAVLLGYADPEVGRAVVEQLSRGVSFSLSHVLEVEVAEMLARMIPCAEQVRFGKNGSDATTAAVRLARACTGRERIAVCGYHGWQDWYIGATTRDLGVPRAVKDLTHSFPFNDSDALGTLLDRYPGEFAAVILEPVGRSMPLPGYLESVKRASRRHGALLIFDETVTGFRVHKGGAQALTGVIPDLATFGKGMANGFPLSAVVGLRRYMSAMEEIFFSATFGGEALSLAAAKSVLARVERDNVPEQLAACGRRLIDGLQSIIVDHRLGESFFVSGHPAWSFLNIRPSGDSDEYAMKTWLLQELFARGILFIGSHNLSAAHTDADIDGLLAAYGDLLPRCRDLALDRRLAEELRAEPLKPLFAVR